MGMGSESDRTLTPEEEMPQWYNLFDLLDSHAKHYVKPTNTFSHG